ncbi:hypothetical protein H4R20_003947 [Coemansia guatemalensis]|uniref:CAP-Gly domain-containing protein n=1 Tax=Coemansia guatemalensis TaxID=2761395 RepID=A0A9W8HZJ4_9FUNG|nr:hypothetical protein H4R20_003947 [Coemansia guatemalensis]
MSKLPRGPATTTTTAGSIRPPSSGVTLPHGLGGKGFLDQQPALPSFTQRIPHGARRATLTTATFMPPTDGSTAIARSSESSLPQQLGRAGSSPSPSTSTSSRMSPTPRTSLQRTPKDSASTISKMPSEPAIDSQPPRSEHGLGSYTPSHINSRGGSMLQRPSRGTPHARPGAAQSQVPPSSHTSAVAQPSSTDDGGRPPRSGSALGLRCGTPVFIPAQGLRGTLRYLGPIEGKQGVWAGIALDDIGMGKNDGTVAGKAYFSCPQNSGIFVAPSKVESRSQKQPQRSPIAHSGTVPTISTVLTSASGDKAQLEGRRLGIGSRSGRLSAVGATVNQTHTRQRSRTRNVSDTLAHAGSPPPVPSPAPAGSSIASPASTRRKTLTRTGSATTAGAVSEQYTGRQPHPRPPPATVSRGSNRPRPISTTGSVASNRTSSPSLSRPSSRTLAPASVDLSALVASPSKSQATARPRIGSGPISNDSMSASALPARRRPTHLAPTHVPGVASRPTPDPTLDTKTGLAMDSAGRLKLRIDMLEAENRVLRLKNEQDKAHLTASQMLAKDLGPASSSARVVATHVSPDASMQQLSDARDTLERERKAGREKIEQLEAEIAKLKAGSREAFPDTTSSPYHDATADKDASIADLRDKLQRSVEAHSAELKAANDARVEASDRLARTIENAEAMQDELRAKASEISILNTRLEKMSSELSRAVQTHIGPGMDREQQQVKLSSEDLERQLELENRIGKLQREIAESEEQRREMATRVEAGRADLSAAEGRAADLEHRLEAAEKTAAEYASSCALMPQIQSHLSQMVEDMRGAAGDMGDSYSVSARADSTEAGTANSQLQAELVEEARRLVALLIERVASAEQPTAASNEPTVGQSHDQQARIQELESENARLSEDRDRLILFESSVNDYLLKVESECNRLVADIEQLHAENQKLREELSAASLQNSTVSLDIGAVDMLLTEDQASNDAGEEARAGSKDMSGVDGDAAGTQHQKHAQEVADLRRRLQDLEERKNSEIRKLQDEIATLEHMVEDKVFGDSELSDTVASLNEKVAQLQRELQRERASSAGNIAGSEPETNKAVPDIVNSVSEVGNSASDDVVFCDICDSNTHSIVDCPEIAIDASRPYCDNCESFVGHWTDECPHGDEMF